MALQNTPVSQSLERKLRIFGFEVPDVLLIFLVLSALNFLFGQTGQKLLFVWSPVATLALTIRIGKRGKPDNFLLHWAKFKAAPKYLTAFPEGDHIPFFKIKGRVKS